MPPPLRHKSALRAGVPRGITTTSADYVLPYYWARKILTLSDDDLLRFRIVLTACLPARYDIAQQLFRWASARSSLVEEWRAADKTRCVRWVAKAYADGVKAKKNGLSETDNPFKCKQDKALWVRGYRGLEPTARLRAKGQQNYALIEQRAEENGAAYAQFGAMRHSNYFTKFRLWCAFDRGWVNKKREGSLTKMA